MQMNLDVKYLNVILQEGNHIGIQARKLMEETLMSVLMPECQVDDVDLLNNLIYPYLQEEKKRVSIKKNFKVGLSQTNISLILKTCTYFLNFKVA